MIKRLILFGMIALLLFSTVSQASVIGPFLKEIATEALKYAGGEAGKSAVDYFKSLFNKNKDIAESKKKPYLNETEPIGKERTWTVTGNLTKNDIQEIANTLKSLDNSKDQRVTATQSSVTNNYTYSTTEVSNVANDGNFQFGHVIGDVHIIVGSPDKSKETPKHGNPSSSNEGSVASAPTPPVRSPEPMAIDAEDPSRSLSVPSDVAIVYVHLQQHGPLVDGSSEIYDIVDREGLINRIEEFRKVARDRNMRLMITAATAGERQWLHNKISYRGKYLKPCVFRDTPSHSNHAGAEFSLE